VVSTWVDIEVGEAWWGGKDDHNVKGLQYKYGPTVDLLIKWAKAFKGQVLDITNTINLFSSYSTHTHPGRGHTYAHTHTQIHTCQVSFVINEVEVGRRREKSQMLLWAAGMLLAQHVCRAHLGGEERCAADLVIKSRPDVLYKYGLDTRGLLAYFRAKPASMLFISHGGSTFKGNDPSEVFFVAPYRGFAAFAAVIVSMLKDGNNGALEDSIKPPIPKLGAPKPPPTMHAYQKLALLLSPLEVQHTRTRLLLFSPSLVLVLVLVRMPNSARARRLRVWAPTTSVNTNAFSSVVRADQRQVLYHHGASLQLSFDDTTEWVPLQFDCRHF
jgi:hypothetical protein